MIDRRPWFVRFPDLLEWELGRFARHALPATIDEARRVHGQLVVESQVEFRGSPLPLQVAYPSEYPELPPAVCGPAGLIPRHQHAFAGNFCLLERPIDDWKAKEWGAADLIVEQLLRLLGDYEAGDDAVAANEAPIPEPASAYFDYAADAAVVIAGNLAEPAGFGGKLRFSRPTPQLFVVRQIGAAQADARLVEVLGGGETMVGHWRRLDRAPQLEHGDGAAVADFVRSSFPGLLSAPLPPRLQRKTRRTSPSLELFGLTFREEGQVVGETRAGWLFLLIDRTGPSERAFLVHSQVLSPEERERRIPELAGTADRRALVLGLGSLGAEVALHLARAGVGRLDLVDFDRFEVTNTVRHPLGVDYTGLPKSQAAALACRRANPFSEITFQQLRVGQESWRDLWSPLSQLAELIERADLVVEATGSHQISQLVGRLCGEADVPLVSGWMTEGLYGAEIVRIAPGRTSCFTCFSTIHRRGQLPAAAAGEEHQVVVQGCSHPTVSGAGFDAAEAAANMARLAISTLAPPGGYPDMGYDYLALSFRQAVGAAPPRVATADLPPDEECDGCRAAVGSIAKPLKA
jgi:hypothetical protein